MSRATAVVATAAKPPSAENFSWALGFRPAIEAPVFAAAHRELGQRLGRAAEAEDVVDAARSPNNVLHDCFDWNVRRAAQAHWVDQASRLIRNLRVTFTTGPVRDLPMRALYRVSVEGTRTWAPHVVAMAEPDLREQVARQILLELRAFVSKYRVFLIAIGAEAQAQALETAVASVVPP